ncbi:MAG TPA: hypothetical protein VEU27_04040, partial [Gemmatimonadales bacterium]|nr:hypothetical protein [Gemmatimonadales bacterium]
MEVPPVTPDVPAIVANVPAVVAQITLVRADILPVPRQLAPAGAAQPVLMKVAAVVAQIAPVCHAVPPVVAQIAPVVMDVPGVPDRVRSGGRRLSLGHGGARESERRGEPERTDADHGSLLPWDTGRSGG